MKKVLLTIFVAGSALLATSCFDNVEPAGLSEMRGAKAELLSAEAAYKLAEAKVQEANALYMQAEAAYKQAEAEMQLLENARYEAQTAHKEAMNALELAKQEAANAEAIAYYESKVAEYEQDIQEIKEAMELAAAKHQNNLMEQQELLAEAEKDYQEALVDLEISLATYKGDKVYDELAAVVIDLGTCRTAIQNCNRTIVSTTNKLIAMQTWGVPKFEAEIEKNVTDKEKDLALKKEALDAWTAARDYNKEQFAAKAEEYKAEMDALVDAWDVYENTVKPDEDENIKSAKAVQYEYQYRLDGNQTTYETAMKATDVNLEPDLTIEPVVLEIGNIPESLMKTVGTWAGVSYPSNAPAVVPVGVTYDEDAKTVTLEINGQQPALVKLQNLETTVKTAVATTAWSASELANNQLVQAQRNQEAQKVQTEYAEKLAEYNTARAAFLAAVQAYNIDLSGTNISTDNHLYKTLLKEIEDFYTTVRANATANPAYTFGVNDVRTLAAKVASFKETVVSLTDNFSFDAPVNIAAATATTPNWVRTSYLYRNNDAKIKEVFVDPFTAAMTPANMATTLLGSAPSLAPVSTVNYPNLTGLSGDALTAKQKELYPSVVRAMLDGFKALYGVNQDVFATVDITEAEFMEVKDQVHRVAGANFANITINNYVGGTNITYDLAGIVVYKYSNNWVSSDTALTVTKASSLMVESKAAELVVADLAYMIANAPNQPALNAFLEYVQTEVEKMEKNVELMTESVAAAKAAVTELEAAQQLYAYQNRVVVASKSGDDVTSAEYSLAERVYMYNKKMWTAFTTYATEYDDIVLSDGTTDKLDEDTDSNGTPTIEEEIKAAEDELATAEKDLAEAQAILKAWTESKVDLDNSNATSDTVTPDYTKAIEYLIAEYETDLAYYKAELEYLLAEFDALEAQRKALMALLETK